MAEDVPTFDEMEFTCPECGGNTYGSWGPTGALVRVCHGYKDDKSCNFKWPEAEDRKYMKPTGRKRALYGGAVVPPKAGQRSGEEES